MSDVKDAVVKRIRALCEEKNIKPNELANRAGLTPSTVYSIFNENRHDVNILRFAYIQLYQMSAAVITPSSIISRSCSSNGISRIISL